MIKTALSAVVLLLLVAAPTAAQNLLTNGRFDNNVAGWPDCNGGNTASWSAQDADGSSTSGSLQIAYSGADTGTCAHQCVPVTPGATYELSAKGFIPSGQSSSLSENAYMEFYSGPGCSGGSSLLTVHETALSATVDTWNSGNLIAQAPAGAAHVDALLQLVDYSHASGVTIVGRWDDLFLGPATTTCTADATHLCLLSNRFQVSVQWTNYNTGVTAPATAVPFNDGSGFFYFGDPNKIEVMVQVKNACHGFKHFWVFYAATTNVGYILSVTDTSSGQTETYSNPAHSLAIAGADETSFGSCPP